MRNLNRERTPTRTATLNIRISQTKPRPRQRFFVTQHRPRHKKVTGLVDNQIRPVLLKDLIPILTTRSQILHIHHIRVPRTPIRYHFHI